MALLRYFWLEFCWCISEMNQLLGFWISNSISLLAVMLLL